MSGKEIARLTHQGLVNTVAFSGDGRYLATSSDDKNVRVFEAESGKEFSRMPRAASALAVGFADDGRYLMTMSPVPVGNGIVVSRDLFRPEHLIADACSRLTRNLTADEWMQYVGIEIPHHKTCPNLP